ncbi:chemoreceptor glutamine deamidase CheD [Solimonas variicoloris]|uniref:chemoreceptor glutamine deamidase CheD n=1 Tax=Solimonas variicoloris TaxID=254408 RepID=UPI000378B9D4|nr:chemoreceptor glutamine deamidase CheD [Solimonas variicoloris]
MNARKKSLAASDDGSYYDPRFGVQAQKVLPGDYAVAGDGRMLVTLLGSCVAACLHDPLAGVGGMNHFLLPGGEGAAGESARYGSYAMEVLINELLKRGATRARLQAKVFGGGAVLPSLTIGNVGERNARFVLDYLAAERIALLAQDLGDIVPRRVHYFPATGRVLVKRLPAAQRAAVAADENRYLHRLKSGPAQGSVELF